MFKSNEKVTGIQYTAPVAMTAMSAIFSPAILILSRPVGLMSVLIAFGFSAICATLAWFRWKNSSRLTIPTLDTTLVVVQ